MTTLKDIFPKEHKCGFGHEEYSIDCHFCILAKGRNQTRYDCISALEKAMAEGVLCYGKELEILKEKAWKYDELCK